MVKNARTSADTRIRFSNRELLSRIPFFVPPLIVIHSLLILGSRSSFIYIYSSKTDFSVSCAFLFFFFLWFSLKWKILIGKEKKLIDRWVDFLKILKNGILLIFLCIYLCFYEYLRGNVKTSSSSSFSSSKIHRVCIKSARGSKKTCFRDKQSNDPC